MALSKEQIAQLWVQQGGAPKWAEPMAAIALRESGGRPKINNRGLNQNGTVDWGLFQVNDIWRKDPVVGKLFQSGAILTPEGATKAAIRILKVQGPQAWASSGQVPQPDSTPPSFATPTAPRVQAPAQAKTPSIRTDLLMDYVSQGAADNQGATLSLAAGLLAQPEKKDTPTRTVRKATPGKPASDAPNSPHAHGKYQGTAGPLLGMFNRWGKPLGLQITSAKRNNTNPLSGSRSDHDYGNTDAYATDVSNGSAPTPEMDEYAYRVARALGIKYKKGTEAAGLTATVDGIRYQLIYRSNFGGNHYNHVHIGAKRV